MLEASAAVPAACASISRTTASEKSPPLSRRSRFDHGQCITFPSARLRASSGARTGFPRRHTRHPRRPGCRLGDPRTRPGTEPNRRQSACHRRHPKPSGSPFHVSTLPAQASASAFAATASDATRHETLRRSSKLTPPTKSESSKSNGNHPRRDRLFPRPGRVQIRHRNLWCPAPGVGAPPHAGNRRQGKPSHIAPARRTFHGLSNAIAPGMPQRGSCIDGA